MLCNMCSGTLITEEIDSRQEWTEEYLVCEDCGREFTLRTEYSQAGLITSQELWDQDNEIVE